MRVLHACLGVALATATGLATPLMADPSYVVQIHSSRDGFVPPTDPSERLRTQLMTTESGHRFECFLPLSPLQKDQLHANGETSAKQIESIGAESASSKDHTALLPFARAAAKKVRPMCVQYEDVVDRWVYEICPGVLIRKVNLKKRRASNPVVTGSSSSSVKDVAEATRKPAKIHEVQELAAFESDGEALPLEYGEFAHGDMEARLSRYSKPLYTQVFRARGAANGQEGGIQVQFLCSAAGRDDLVGAVRWRHEGGDKKEPAAFVIASRLFCNPKHSDPADKFSVGSLLQPLVEMRTCIKRNEGWWTYEFCFGHGIRQYHRESDGKVTAEFSLGSYDSKVNAELEASGASLVTEHIDATHDSARPAFVEAYSGGTHCKEFDVSTPRKSRVFFHCSQGSASHHILSVKETQTCTYTIKISSSVVCDHPHFITEEQKTEDKAEVVHCIPVAPEEDSVLQSTAPPTRAPATEPTGEEQVAEVEVPAT